MTEAIRRSEHEPTREELACQKADSWSRPARWNYAPSGDLKLTVESCEYAGINRTWTDGKRRKLEACLGEVLVTCQKLPAAVKKEREARAEAERLRREEEKRRAEEASRKAEYDRRAKAVKELTHSWQESRLLHEFAGALSTKTDAAADLSDVLRNEPQGMIEWTLHNAAYVDPLTDLKCALEQFKRPSWSLLY